MYSRTAHSPSKPAAYRTPQNHPNLDPPELPLPLAIPLPLLPLPPRVPEPRPAAPLLTGVLRGGVALLSGTAGSRTNDVSVVLRRQCLVRLMDWDAYGIKRKPPELT